VSEPEPDSPGDSGTDLRHDSHHNDIGAKDTSDDQSDMETETEGKLGTIGIRSDLLPMHPVPKEGLTPGSQASLEANLQGLPALEALRRQAGASQFLPGLPLPSFPAQSQGSRPSQPPTPQSTGSNDLGGSWTFEEQFKQLYEIDDNPKRREFLDELFSFMQKRGTPINRLPIMAKQVLDLYELFNLVVARGGLVEVINKKQWQEIIKGLGLPSSITSAAFTLRTQYTKYLYPYESHTKGLSSSDDLQNAIDGNRREGRRMEPYPMTSQMSPMGPLGHHLPASLHSPPRGHGAPMSPGAGAEQLQAIEMTKLALWKLYNQGQPGAMPGLPPLMPSLPNLDLFGANQKEALNLHMAERAEKEQAEKQKRETEEREEQRRREKQLQERLAADQMRQEKDIELKERLAELDKDRDQSSPPPAKRQRDTESPILTSLPRNSTNISMASRQEEDGRTSMEMSLEINGTTYSGVLFARPS